MKKEAFREFTRTKLKKGDRVFLSGLAARNLIENPTLSRDEISHLNQFVTIDATNLNGDRILVKADDGISFFLDLRILAQYPEHNIE